MVQLCSAHTPFFSPDDGTTQITVKAQLGDHHHKHLLCFLSASCLRLFVFALGFFFAVGFFFFFAVGFFFFAVGFFFFFAVGFFFFAVC